MWVFVLGDSSVRKELSSLVTGDVFNCLFTGKPRELLFTLGVCVCYTCQIGNCPEKIKVYIFINVFKNSNKRPISKITFCEKIALSPQTKETRMGIHFLVKSFPSALIDARPLTFPGRPLLSVL